MMRQLQRSFEPSAQETAARKLFTLASRDAVIRGALATPRHVSNLLMMAQSVSRGCQACTPEQLCRLPAALCVGLCLILHPTAFTASCGDCHRSVSVCTGWSWHPPTTCCQVRTSSTYRCSMLLVMSTCVVQLAAISLLWLVTNKNPAAARMVAHAQGIPAVLPFLQDSSQLHRRAAAFITCQLLEESSLQVLQP